MFSVCTNFTMPGICQSYHVPLINVWTHQQAFTHDPSRSIPEVSFLAWPITPIMNNCETVTYNFINYGLHQQAFTHGRMGMSVDAARKKIRSLIPGILENFLLDIQNNFMGHNIRPQGSCKWQTCACNQSNTVVDYDTLSPMLFVHPRHGTTIAACVGSGGPLSLHWVPITN